MLKLTPVENGHVIAFPIEEMAEAVKVRCAACGDVIKDRHGPTSARKCPGPTPTREEDLFWAPGAVEHVVRSDVVAKLPDGTTINLPAGTMLVVP